jgi:pimeloyl-[acyl-carrier protein] synthase
MIRLIAMTSDDQRFPENGDPTLPGYSDPYPYYHWLRSNDAVHFSEFMQGWVLTRHADAVAYLKDRRFSRASYLRKMREKFGADEPIFAFQAHELAFTDPPEHTWMKNVFGKAFSPAAIARMRPATEAIVRARLDALAGHREIDIVADVAYPIPADVIAAMLGAPAEDWEKLRELVDGIVVSRGIVRTPQMMEEGSRSVRRFNDYFVGLLEERRRRPTDDLLSAILVAEDSGRKLSDEQVLSMVETLFAAGHATTRSLIANGVLVLLSHPAELKKLRENPALIASAAEEMLRYESPTQAPSPQAAMEDVELGGKTIRKGEIVTVLFGAANRDPARFPDPDRFDIERADNEHLAFSMGIHYCLGASLARLEAQVAIAAIVARYPNIRLSGGEPEWRSMGRFRGLQALTVRI